MDADNAAELKNLNHRRRQLGMSYAALADRSGVPFRTVVRILSGKQKGANFANVLAIAEALGAGIHFDRNAGVEEFREQQARKKATRLVSMLQGTSALEGQAVDEEMIKQMISQTVHELLAGPKRRLWSES
jgi:transcriptional regulator with XRE-family HTH domain